MARFAVTATTLTLLIGLATACAKSSSGELGTDYARPDGGPAPSAATTAGTSAKLGSGFEAEAQRDAAARSPASDTAWRDADDEVALGERRPGLGTAYGEQRRSSVESVGFRRADPARPDVVFSIHYDDAAGVRALARSRGGARGDALMQHGGLSFAVIDSRGEPLPAARVGEELYAVGDPGQRYSLAVANDTGSAFEFVASVDGLDVINGRPASFGERGYIIDPFSSLVIDGWRTSEDSVAAFRFSSLEDSYAERTGQGSNVGVIGAALFREARREGDWSVEPPRWRPLADPFPGN